MIVSSLNEKDEMMKSHSCTIITAQWVSLVWLYGGGCGGNIFDVCSIVLVKVQSDPGSI